MRLRNVLMSVVCWVALSHATTDASSEPAADPILAQVGETPIRAADYLRWLSAQPDEVIREHKQKVASREDWLKEEANFQLLALAAQREGYDRSPALHKRVDSQLVQSLVYEQIDRLISTEQVTDKEVDAFVKAQGKEFAPRSTVRASHILLASEATALKVRDEAKTLDMAGFADLAKTRSLDQETNQRGGDLRYFDREGRPLGNGPAVEESIAQAAFGLHELGAISAPVPVGERFSIVQLTGRREVDKAAQEKFRSEVREQLSLQKRRKALTELLTQLKGRYKPEVHAERIEDIVPPAAPMGGGHPGFPEGGRAR